jgi:hypothetical protein
MTSWWKGKGKGHEKSGSYATMMSLCIYIKSGLAYGSASKFGGFWRLHVALAFTCCVGVMNDATSFESLVGPNINELTKVKLLDVRSRCT